MLVLLRKTGEEIQIGSAINVRVLTVSKHRVKLGVSGPRDVSVMRRRYVKAFHPMRRSHLRRRALEGESDD